MVKFLKQVSGQLREEATATAGGVPNANKIPELDASGRLAATMMPTGIGADTQVLPASEALAAGNFVNIWNDAGTVKVRKADAATAKTADGFVLAAFALAANATVYFEGNNDQLVGLTTGVKQFLGASGAATATAPTATGSIVQQVGVSISATVINVEFDAEILLA